MIENQSLKTYNTFRIDASSRYFLPVKSIEEVQDYCHQQQWQQMPQLILGGGSNILFSQDFAGVVIKNEILGFEKVKEDSHSVWLTVGAGEQWQQLVQYCLDRNYAGLENLSLIPGTVGAAPIQNIGAYGVEFESVFDSLQAVECKTGNIKTFDAQDCQFAYRNSIFKQALKGQYIIVTVTVRLNKCLDNVQLDYERIQSTLSEMGIDEPTIQDVSAAVIQLRQAKLPNPNKIGNAGSFFKNPIISSQCAKNLKKELPTLSLFAVDDDATKVSAAALIEAAGWKGKSYGGAAVSEQHALVLVNKCDASGQDVLALSKQVQDDIKKRYNVQLETEVNII